MASLSPNAIAFSLAVTGTAVAAGRVLFKSLVPSRQAPVAVVPPVLHDGIPPAAATVTIPPIAPAVSNDSTDHDPVPVLPVPVAAAVVINFASAMASFDLLLAAMHEALLDITPLVGTVSAVVRRGPRGSRSFRINGMSDHALYTVLLRYWNGARRKGEYQLGLGHFSVANAVGNVRTRAERVLGVIHDNTQLWVGRGDINTEFKEHPFVAREHVVPRVGYDGTKAADTFCEAAGLMSDTIWVHHIFLIVKVLAMRYGASGPQSTYMGVSVAIDALCVSYGIDPRMGVDGVTAEDLGVVVPTDLPQLFVRN